MLLKLEDWAGAATNAGEALAVDSDKMCRKLVRLLAATYFPTANTSASAATHVVQRVIVFVRQNPVAALNFYRHAHKAGPISVSDVACLIEDLGALVDKAVAAARVCAPHPATISTRASGGHADIFASSVEGVELELSDDGDEATRSIKRRKLLEAEKSGEGVARAIELLSTDETAVIGGLIVVLGALRSSISKSLAKPVFAPLVIRLNSLLPPATVVSIMEWARQVSSGELKIPLSPEIPGFAGV